MSPLTESGNTWRSECIHFIRPVSHGSRRVGRDDGSCLCNRDATLLCTKRAAPVSDWPPQGIADGLHPNQSTAAWGGQSVRADVHLSPPYLSPVGAPAGGRFPSPKWLGAQTQGHAIGDRPNREVLTFHASCLTSCADYLCPAMSHVAVWPAMIVCECGSVSSPSPVSTIRPTVIAPRWTVNASSLPRTRYVPQA